MLISGKPDNLSLSGPERKGTIKAVTSAPIPLVSHESRTAEESIDPRNVAATPEHQVAAQRQIGTTMVIAVIRGVASPQAAESFAVARIAGRFNELIIRDPFCVTKRLDRPWNRLLEQT